MIREALAEPVKAIIQTIRGTLETTPPELAADLVTNGVTLAGGGVLLRSIDRRIEEDVQLPVRVAESPLECVAKGTGEFLNRLDRYSKVLESSEDT